MPTETPTLIPNWNGLEGKVLEGGYEIQQCLNARESAAAFKIRVLGDRFTSAVAHVSAPAEAGPRQIALWKDALQLRHPNISSPMSVGLLEFENSALPYRVLVRPDETLETVIEERSLSTEETREVLSSLLNALEFLHANGFADPELSPGQILAIGDSVKLSAEGIRRINTPLEGEENPSPAGDVYQLGATVFQALTQKPFGEGCREEAARLPAPFNAMVQCACDPDTLSRCSLADIRAMLSGRQVRPAAKPEPARPVSAPRLVSAGPVSAGPVSAGSPVLVSAPVAARVPTARPRENPIEARRELRRERAEQPREIAPLKKAVYLLAALLLAAGVFWLARPRHSGTHRVTVGPPAPAAETAQKAGPPQDGTAWPTRALGPQANGGAAPGQSNTERPVSQAKTARPVASPGASERGQIWRVIAFTYAREADAQKRVESINSAHPGFQPEVFSPDGSSGPYLVVLGGRMTRDDASRLRQKARDLGLPHDSYIQNYNR